MVFHIDGVAAVGRRGRRSLATTPHWNAPEAESKAKPRRAAFLYDALVMRAPLLALLLALPLVAQHGRDFNMGELSTASPITYEVDGKQYVALASATAVFAFGLFEPAEPLDPPKIVKRK